MPHVDEGTLHALLDGALRAMEPGRAAAVEAHLESCAECRALAEEAADLRGRAGEVLGLLEPGVAPDFEEVLVRAGAAGGPAPRGALVGQTRWTRRLAWAATVVIALGTGYLIRDRLVPERAASFSAEAPDARDGSPVDAGPRRAAEAAEGPGPEQPAERGAMTDGGGAGTGAAAARREAQEAVGSPTRAVSDAAAAEPGTPEHIAVAPAPPPPPPEAAPAGRVAGDADAGIREALVPVESAPALGARVEQEQLPVQEMMFAATPPAPRSRVITPQEAADLLDGPFLVLPRAEVTRVTVEPGEHGEVVVSLQRLAEDVVIRVTQAPEREPEPLGRAMRARPMSAAPAPPAPMKVAAEQSTGTSTVRVRVSGAELVLEGPLPRAALELLGGAAAPYARPR